MSNDRIINFLKKIEWQPCDIYDNYCLSCEAMGPQKAHKKNCELASLIKMFETEELNNRGLVPENQVGEYRSAHNAAYHMPYRDKAVLQEIVGRAMPERTVNNYYIGQMLYALYGYRGQ